MRTKNFNLLKRGRKWYLRYDIPADVRNFFPEIKSRTREEALKTIDEKEARRLRNRRLGQLERSWNILRDREWLGRKSGVYGAEISSWEEWAFAVSSSHGPDDMEALDISLSDEFGKRVEDVLRQRRIHNSDFDARERIAEEIAASPYGQRLARTMLIAEGKVTPISAVADEWLATKSKVSSSSLYTYRKALAVLQERFQTVEEVTHRDARNFLFGLLKDLNKRTVGQYLIAYRGVWKHLGRMDVGMWNTEGMSGAKDSVPILPWDDEDYIKLLTAAEARGHRDMWLAIRIAAHTGAAASGIARLEVRDDAAGRSLFLHETKKEHRSRLIPCHPTIHDDIAEWQNEFSHDQISLSRKFGRLKSSLGYGRDKVLHSFRHSVANKLENARVMDREIQRLLGHKIGKISFDTYNAQGLGYETLSKVVTKIRWPSVK